MQKILQKKPTTKQIGEIAEKIACEYLQKNQLKLVMRNYRCRTGEIDIIMRDREMIVFVEVRYRKNYDYGGAIMSIDTRKQTKICAAATHFLQFKQLNEQVPCRFDVVTITGHGLNRVEWIKDAFQSR